MSRGIQAFKQTDAVKALKAAKSAGFDVQRFEIDRAGKIVIIIGKPAANEPAALVAGDDVAALVPADEGWADAP